MSHTTPADTVRDHARFMPPDAQALADATPRKASPWSQWPYGLVGGAIGLAGMWLGRWLHDGPIDLSALPPLSALLVLLAAVLSLWPNIVLHEAGHALAGVSRGMRMVAFGIGRWRWQRGQSQWQRHRGTRVAGIAGFASLLPQGARGLSKIDQAVFLLGGPLANLATAALCLALLPLAAESRLGTSLLVGISACALLLGLSNLVPFTTHGWRSDGRGLLDLLRGKVDAELGLRCQRLLALSMAGVRPREWPPSLLPAADACAEAPIVQANADILRLAWAMDAGQQAEADACAARLVQQYTAAPPAFRPHLAVTLGWHAARILRDRQVLAAWRPLCEGGVLDLSLLRAWLDAELASLHGDPVATRQHVQHARGLLPTAIDPVTALQLGEYLDALDAGSTTEPSGNGNAVKFA